MQNDLLRYQFIAENTLDLICETTLEGFYTYVSSSYRDVLGYEQEELLNQHFGALVHPDDQPALLAAFARHASEMKPGQATFRHRHKDGSWRWLETLGKPIQRDDGSIRAVFVSRDITERKQAESRLHRMEDRLKMVISHTPVILCATDAEGIVTLFEGQGLEELGLSPGAVVGKPIFDVYRNQPETVALLRRVLAGETLMTTVEAEGRVFEAHFAPACEEGNTICGLAGVSIDVTESRAARQALGEERLKRSRLEALAVLAGGIAHDFNNLLTGILGNLSLAQMKAEPNSALAEHLADAETACLRTRDMVSELSTFAKGGGPVKKPLRLEQSIQQAVGVVTRGTGIRCEVRIEPGLWGVAADEPQINQVLYNLLMNARQAMPAGGVVEIDARNSPGPDPLAAGRYVAIRVTDHGAGIRSEHLGRIFEPYFTTKKAGHGLGLATAHSIVSNHGGALLAESPEGAGATFTMYLPAALETAAPKTRAPEPPRDVAHARILVMDDEESIRVLMKRILSGNGFEVEAADDGKKAVQRYREAYEAGKPFDVVLLDLQVPLGMGGFEAFQAMRAINPGVKAIVSSGYSENPVMANYRKHGIAAVVPKPYHARQLLAAARELVGSH